MKNTHALRTALCAFLMLSSQACTSWTTLRPAKSMGQDATEVILVPEVIGVPDAGALPSLEVYVRHGITDIFDLGIKLFPVGLGLDFNVELLSGSHFALSLDPGFTASFIYGTSSDGQGNNSTSSAFIGSLWLPVLVDVLRTEHVIITLGPKIGYLFVSSRSSADNSGSTSNLGGFAFGGSLAVRFQITQGFAITPEFAAISTTEALDGNSGASALLYNANIGLGF